MTSTTKPVRYTIRDAGDAIRRRETFVAGDGSLTSETLHGPGPLSWGRAPQSITDAIRAARAAADAPLYIVMSYGTPIAWAGPGEQLTVPDVRYSVTTSRHQSICRRADYTDGLCHGESPAGHGDPRCGRKGGHIGECDWCD